MPSRLKKQKESKYQSEKKMNNKIFKKLLACPQLIMKTKNKKYEWFAIWRVKNLEIFL